MRTLPADPWRYGQTVARRTLALFRATGTPPPARPPMGFAEFCASEVVQGAQLGLALDFASAAARAFAATWTRHHPRRSP